MERAVLRLGFVLPIFFTLLSATFAGPVNVSDMEGSKDSVEQVSVTFLAVFIGYLPNTEILSNSQ